MSLHFERTFSSTEMPRGIHELVYTMSAPETCHVRFVSNCIQNCCGGVFRKRMQPMRSCPGGALAAMTVMQQQHTAESGAISKLEASHSKLRILT